MFLRKSKLAFLLSAPLFGTLGACGDATTERIVLHDTSADDSDSDTNTSETRTVAQGSSIGAFHAVWALEDDSVVAGAHNDGSIVTFWDTRVDDTQMVALSSTINVMGFKDVDNGGYKLIPMSGSGATRAMGDAVEFVDGGVQSMNFTAFGDNAFVMLFRINYSGSVQLADDWYLVAGFVDATDSTPVLTLSPIYQLGAPANSLDWSASIRKIGDNIYTLGLAEGSAKIWAAYVDAVNHDLVFAESESVSDDEPPVVDGIVLEADHEAVPYSLVFTQIADTDEGPRAILSYIDDIVSDDGDSVYYRPVLRNAQFVYDADNTTFTLNLGDAQYETPRSVGFIAGNTDDSLLDMESMDAIAIGENKIALFGLVTSWQSSVATGVAQITTWIVNWQDPESAPIVDNGTVVDPDENEALLPWGSQVLDTCTTDDGVFAISYNYNGMWAYVYSGDLNEDTGVVTWTRLTEEAVRNMRGFLCDRSSNSGVLLWSENSQAHIETFTFTDEGTATQSILVGEDGDVDESSLSLLSDNVVAVGFGSLGENKGYMRNFTFGPSRLESEVVGITDSAAQAGATVEVTTGGIVQNDAWEFTIGVECYATEDGEIVQDANAGPIVGVAVDTDALVILRAIVEP